VEVENAGERLFKRGNFEGGGQRVGSSGICIPSTHVAHAESSAFLFPFKSGNLIPFVATQLKFHLFNLLNTYIPFGVLFLFLFQANILGNMPSRNVQQRGRKTPVASGNKKRNCATHP